MAVLFRANTDLVAVAWLGGVAGLSPSMVASTLPATTNASWAASGFVTVRTSGGQSGVYMPVRSPVVTVDTYAVNPGSSKPPWGKANSLAELVVRGCYPRTDAERVAMQRPLSLPANYPTARVLSAYVVSEPRRAYGDSGDYAHFVLDVALNWVDLS